MAKPQSPRKVVIRLTSRNPKDRLALLQAVEKAFRTHDVEIAIGATTDQPEGVPNEQLEAKATEHCSKILDQKDRDTGTTERAPQRADDVEVKRNRLGSWVAKNAAAGFRILVKVLPVAKKIKQLLD